MTKAMISKSMQKRIEAQTGEKLFTRQEVDAQIALFAKQVAEAIDKGVEKWQAANCHDPGCGCVSEWVKREVTALVPDPHALDVLIAAAFEKAAQHFPTLFDGIRPRVICSCGTFVSDTGLHEARLDAWNEHIRSLTPADALQAQREHDAALRAQLEQEENDNASLGRVCGERGKQIAKLEADNAALRRSLQSMEDKNRDRL